MTPKELSQLQLLLEPAEKRLQTLRTASLEAAEIAHALDAALAIVAVHRIRAEIQNSNSPFEVKYPRDAGVK